jgi:hypothetical protein
MAEVYNPSAPSVIGQEWVPVVNSEYAPDFTTERGHSFKVPSDLDSYNVSYGRFYISDTGSGEHEGQTPSIVVYQKGKECATGPIKKITVPVSAITVDPSANGTLTTVGGTLLNSVQNPGDEAFFFVNNTSGVGAPAVVIIRVNFDMSSFDTLILNKRILNVSIVSQFTGPFADSDVAFTSFETTLIDNANNILSIPYTRNLFNVDQRRSSNITPQTINLGEGNTIWNTAYPSIDDNLVVLPWTDDDLLRFVDGAANELRLQIAAIVPFGSSVALTCGYIAMEVTYCEENRILVGGVANHSPSTIQFNSLGYITGSNEIPLYTPQTRTFGTALTLNNEYTVALTMMDTGDIQNAGSLPTVYAARQLYDIKNLPGILITKSLTEGTAYACESSDLMPQLSLVGNFVRGTDNFSRVVAECWGTASDGVSSYICGGSGGVVAPTDASVNGTMGIHSVPVANAFRESQMLVGGFGWVDFDATISFRTTFADVLGAAIEPGNITVHYDSVLLNALLFRVSIQPDESINLDILKDVGGTVRGTSVTVFPAGSWTANNFWAVRIRAQNQSFMMRVWDINAVSEPPWWQHMAFEDFFVRDAISRVGFRSGVAFGNTNVKPVIFQYDDASVVVPDIITGVHAYGSQIALPVYDAIEVTQDVRNLSDSVSDYPNVRFYARTFGNTDVPLTLTDASVPTRTATITVEEFNALPELTNGWKEVNLRFNTAPTFNATETVRAFTWSSTGLNVSNQWQILAATARASYIIDSAKPYPDVRNPTYVQSNGATWLSPNWDTVVEREDPRTDAVIMFSRDAPAPSGLTVMENFVPVTGIGLECGIPPECVATGIAYNEISWLPVSSGPGVTGISDEQFGYYELQRRDDVDDEWVTVMQGTSRSVTGFADYEARIGIQSDYRIRTCNSMDFCGQWSSNVSSTITAPGIQIGKDNSRVLIFTTNEVQDGSSSLAYTPVWADTVDEAFTFPEAETQTLQRMYGKDFFTAFRPLERGGEQFTRTLLIQAASAPLPILERFALNIRDLAWADLPYVCVRTEDGDRWYANVLIPSGSIMRQRKIQLVQAQITEVTDTPSIVIVDG